MGSGKIRAHPRCNTEPSSCAYQHAEIWEVSLVFDGAGANEGVSLQLNPSSLIGADQIATPAPNFGSLPESVVLDYPFWPAMEETSLPSLRVLEYLRPAFGALQREHIPFPTPLRPG